MSLILRPRKRLRRAVCAVVLLMPLLAGCQEHKVVARVNTQPILEGEYLDRTQRVRLQDLQQYMQPQMAAQMAGLEIGGISLVTMIQDRLIDQLAESRHVKTSDEEVHQYVAALQRLHPQIDDQIRNGALDEEDLQRQMRQRILMTAVGTDNATVDPKELHDYYTAHLAANTPASLAYPETWTLRMVPAQDLSLAQIALDEIKRSGDFSKAEQTVHQSALYATISPGSNTLPANLREALAGLAPGQFMAKPVAVQNPSRPTPVYLIGQMVSKQPPKVPTEDEIRAYVKQMILEQKYPQAPLHAQTELQNFTRAANIQINIARYQPLLQRFIQTQQTASAPVQGGTITPPPPPSGSQTQPPGRSGSQPPVGGKTPSAPNSSGKPPTAGGR